MVRKDKEIFDKKSALHIITQELYFLLETQKAFSPLTDDLQRVLITMLRRFHIYSSITSVKKLLQTFK